MADSMGNLSRVILLLIAAGLMWGALSQLDLVVDKAISVPAALVIIFGALVVIRRKK